MIFNGIMATFLIQIISNKWCSSCIRTHSLTSMVPPMKTSFVSLLAIANKYQINSLKEASIRYLSKMITLDNIADMRYYAHLYDSSRLLNTCLLFVRQHVHQLFKDDSFLSKCMELGL